MDVFEVESAFNFFASFSVEEEYDAFSFLDDADGVVLFDVEGISDDVGKVSRLDAVVGGSVEFEAVVFVISVFVNGIGAVNDVVGEFVPLEGAVVIEVDVSKEATEKANHDAFSVRMVWNEREKMIF